ncbi:hypothetical protein T481_08605 [Enterococcus faecalis PF3]|nr:hypothetical protein T481_08605 [Enterococcus faecalis PF3]
MGFLKGRSAVIIHERHANLNTIMEIDPFGQKAIM